MSIFYEVKKPNFFYASKWKKTDPSRQVHEKKEEVCSKILQKKLLTPAFDEFYEKIRFDGGFL